MGLNKRLINTGGAGGIDATEYFDVQTYTGNAATRTFTTGFQTDLVWVNKNNNSAGFYDSQRLYYRLDPSSTLGNTLDASGINAFNSDGFTMAGSSIINQSSQDYVDWAWSGGGSAVSNFDGTITSTVSANQDAGFSVVKYTGNGTSSATIGHGLSSTLDFIIIKRTDTFLDWAVYHSSVGENYWLLLQRDLAAQGTSSIWNQTAPTSSVFTVGNASQVNASGGTYIAYCFHSVDGYQKTGSYTGDGTSSNSITGLGFQPRWLLLKRTDSNGYWSVFDSANGPSVRNFVDIANGWQTGTSFVFSFYSDGFTLGTASEYNINTANYVYLAIA